MSNSINNEGGKRRLPPPPPPPIISKTQRGSNDFESQYYRRSSSKSKSYDSMDNYESQHRRSSIPKAYDCYESQYHKPSSPFHTSGSPPSKIIKEESAQYSQSQNISVHQENFQKQPVGVIPPTQQIVRCILNADEVKIPRRPEESKTPIFDRKEIRESYSNSGRFNESNSTIKIDLVNVEPILPLPMQASPTPTVDQELAVINTNNGDLRFTLRQKQLNPFFKDGNIQNEMTIEDIVEEHTTKMVSHKKSRTVVVSSSPPYSYKRLDIESEDIQRKKYYKRRDEMEEADEYYDKRGVICKDQIKSIKKRKTRFEDQSAKLPYRYSHSDQIGKSQVLKSENIAKSTAVEAIDFKQMTLDWAATAPDQNPSPRITFLRQYFECCTGQELHWAKNWAINISKKHKKKARNE